MPDIVFGDNHFFGINHLSIEKADRYKTLFSSNEALTKVFQSLARNGVNEQMISAHATAGQVCRVALATHPTLKIHPVIPYAHAINDSAASEGVIKTAVQLLRPSVIDICRLMGQLLHPRKDAIIPYSSVDRFIRRQLRVFGDIPPENRGVLFMSNVFTDLLIGLGAWEWIERLNVICKKYGYSAGVITYNPSAFLNRINLPISLCINYNHKHYLTNIEHDALDTLIRQYPVWAMGVFGSGAYSASDVVADLKTRDFRKVVFASSREGRLREFVTSLGSP